MKFAPLFVLPVIALAATAAGAADMVSTDAGVVMPPDVVAPVKYMSIEGGPLWNNADFDQQEIFGGPGDKYGNIDDEQGFYVAATYRRLFKPEWDWQATVTGTWVDTSADSSGGLYKFKSDLEFQTLDFDFGYHPNANPLNRLLLGVRALHLKDRLQASEIDMNETASSDAEGWAFGPRAGFQTETMLGGSKFGFVAEGSGSILFGNFDTDYDIAYMTDGNLDKADDNRTIYNLEALAGLSWHATETFTLTAGYRVQKWWNLRDGAMAAGDFYVTSADADPLFHGPFLRAATSF